MEKICETTTYYILVICLLLQGPFHMEKKLNDPPIRLYMVEVGVGNRVNNKLSVG